MHCKEFEWALVHMQNLCKLEKWVDSSLDVGGLHLNIIPCIFLSHVPAFIGKDKVFQISVGEELKDLCAFL